MSHNYVDGGFIKMNKKGNIIGLLSGLTWAMYTIVLYTVLNLYSNSKGDLLSVKGIMLILVTTILISLADLTFNIIFELIVIQKSNLMSEFKSVLFSKKGFGIIPAAILAGPLGLIPYAIASAISAPVAGAFSALYPVVGAVASFIVFKEKLSKVKAIGGIISILGIILTYQLESVSLAVYIIALIPAFGWGLEAIFGYKLIKDDVNPIVTITIRHIYSIVILGACLLIFLPLSGEYSYVMEFYKGIQFGDMLAGFSVSFIWPVFALGSFIGATSYILWYVSMKYISVAPAMILNISYVLWIPVILSLPPFSQEISANVLLGCIVVFLGTSLVIVGDTLKLRKKQLA
jgi:drug/metabolite transporter (DMT)-like permease